MNANPQVCRGFAMAGLICSAVSLIIGGTLLSILGIAFGAYAYFSAKKLLQANAQDAYAFAAFKLARNVLVFSIIAAVMNLLTAVFFYPALMGSVSSVSSSSAF